jgi:hypothetical protein
MKALAGIFITLCLYCSTANAQRIKSLIPAYAKVQYAGSIGFISLGLGYGFLKNRINTEIMYGYVPATKGGPLDIATFRLICNPFAFNLTQSISLIPINISGFVSYHFGDQFYVKLPQQYYRDYYKWSSAIRYHAGFGSMVAYKSKHNGHGFAVYYEFNTNDLYVKSLRANSTLNLGDILSLGMGVKIY